MKWNMSVKHWYNSTDKEKPKCSGNPRLPATLSNTQRLGDHCEKQLELRTQHISALAPQLNYAVLYNHLIAHVVVNHWPTFISLSFSEPVEWLQMDVHVFSMEAVTFLFSYLNSIWLQEVEVFVQSAASILETHRYFCLQSCRNLGPSYLQMIKQCSNFHFSIPPSLDSVVLLTGAVG
jgi:hypothetical protein